MTTTPEPLTVHKSSADTHFDPDSFRMSIGDHLEELRRRILLGLAGIVITGIVCLIFGQRLVSILCQPLVDALQKYDISPQLYTDQATDAFMVYIKISMIAAACIASPWMIYQLWQFVAAGLYPNERKTFTKFIPLSITLLLGGMVFVYFIVLPMTLSFFVQFTAGMPLHLGTPAPSKTAPTTQPTFVQAVHGTPDHPRDMQIWFDLNESRLKMMAGERIRVVPFGPNQLLATHFTLPDYLDLVLQLLLTFGLAFQLPLVVMALARIGIVDVAQLKSWRRYAYFGMVVLAAALSPGDVITATLALMVPLILLYEFGIWLAKAAEKKSAARD